MAYLHLVEADWDDAPQFTEDFRQAVRARFAGLIVAGKYDLERANWVIEHGYADLVAFGRLFIANPDLPTRDGLPLAPFDPATLFLAAPNTATPTIRPRCRPPEVRQAQAFRLKGSMVLITGASKGCPVAAVFGATGYGVPEEVATGSDVS